MITEQWAFLKDVAKLIVKADELGFTLTGGELWRPESQAWINSQPAGTYLKAAIPNGDILIYHEKVGGVGIAHSKHMDRLAIDFNIFGPDKVSFCAPADIEPLAQYWESLDPKNRAGLHFTHPDPPHFERNIS